MNADVPTRQLALAGLVAIVFGAAVGLVLLAYGRGDFDDTYEFTAVFPTSSQGMFTDGGTEVKMHGINVGTVRGIALRPDGRVEVRFAIRDGVRIPASAEARIQPLSVFGPKYVNLLTDGASADAPAVPSGGELAKATTGAELTDVLDEAGGLFSAVDTNDLVTIIAETSGALTGNGDTLARGIDAGAALSEVAHGRRDLIAPFLEDLRTITGTTASRSDEFLARTDDFDVVASLVADNADDVLAALEGTATLATRGTQLIGDSASDFDVTVRAMARILRTVHADRARIPSTFDAVGAFFDMLGAGMRLPGPDGKKLTALKGFITVDLCLVYGVCLLPEGGLGPTTTPLPTGGDGAPAPGGLGPLLDTLLGPLGGDS